MTLDLPRITPDAHRTTADFDASLSRLLPDHPTGVRVRVGSALASAVRPALPHAPRMVDFVMWVAAALGIGYEPADILSARQQRRADRVDLVLETSPVAYGILPYLERHGRVEGNVAFLLYKARRSALTAVWLLRVAGG